MSHLDTALHKAEQATILADEWVARVRKNKDYPVFSTKWYAGLSELRVAISVLESTAPPWYAQRVLYMTDVDDRMCAKFAMLGPSYTMALSADQNESGPGGAYYASDNQIALARSGWGHVISWCDCSATPLSFAVDMKSQRGLDGVSGQFEQDSEYVNMLSPPGPVAVAIGNPGSLSAANRADATARSTRGHLGKALKCAWQSPITLGMWITKLKSDPNFPYSTTKWYAALKELEQARFNPTSTLLCCIGEVMHADPTYSAQGVPITSACFYLNRDARERGNQPLSNFSVMPASLRAACSLYVDKTMSDADFDLWGLWT